MEIGKWYHTEKGNGLAIKDNELMLFNPMVKLQDYYSGTGALSTGLVRFKGEDLNKFPAYNKQFAFYGVEAPTITDAENMLQSKTVFFNNKIHLYGVSKE